jgi:hypothetical protein
MISPSQAVVYRNARGAWVEGRRPGRGEQVLLRTGIPFSATAGYYANIIDYGRVVLSIIALVLILHAEEYQCVPGLARARGGARGVCGNSGYGGAVG